MKSASRALKLSFQGKPPKNSDRTFDVAQTNAAYSYLMTFDFNWETLSSYSFYFIANPFSNPSHNFNKNNQT